MTLQSQVVFTSVRSSKKKKSFIIESSEDLVIKFRLKHERYKIY